MSCIVFAESLSGAVSRSDAARAAEARRASCVTTPISDVDVAWAKALSARVSASRDELHRLQQDLRAAPEGAELEDAVLARDVARHAHINLLAQALAEHDERCIPPRVDALRQEAESLQGDLVAAPSQSILVGSSLTKRLRLTKLCGPAAPNLLLELSEWEKEAAHMGAELEDLRPHGGGQAPSMEDLHSRNKLWKSAKKTLRLAKFEEENASDEDEPSPAQRSAQDKVRSARLAVQKAERELRLERVRLATLAAAHFPELFAKEPLLRLGVEADGNVLQDVLLVERDLDHYTGPDGSSAKSHMLNAPNNARHRVAVFDGEPCVLKEYELGKNAKQWERLLKEVRLLCELRHPHIAALQAVFQQPGDSPVAYLQLAFYEGGDLSQWLEAQAPDMPRRKTVLQQLAQALQHMHAHGAAHGDVKLENVLISAQGTAHLADFELSREEQLHVSTTRVGVTTVGFTPQYVAPEMRSGAAPMPSAAADMYAFGVCILLACCPEGSCSFAPSGELQQWSREMAAQVDIHLPALLDSLLVPAESAEEALARRLSATQVLLHPFLDMTAEREEASRASEEAQQLMQAAQSEEERMRRKLHAEQQLVQRKLQWEAAETRKQLGAEEEAAKRSIEKKRREVMELKASVQKERSSVQAKASAVQHKAEKVEAHEQKVAAKEAQATKKEAWVKEIAAAADTKAKEIEEKKKDLKAQEAKLAKIQATKRASPSYWSDRSKWIALSKQDGFALVPLDSPKDKLTVEALKKFLKTDGSWLGKGADTQHYPKYDNLQFSKAWRIENPLLWEKFAAGQQRVTEDMKRLHHQKIPTANGMPATTASTAGGLPALLDKGSNETILFHGTSVSGGVLMNILSNGLNERFAGSNAGTAYGAGAYLAEDTGKNDQYCKVDPSYNSAEEVHKRLFAHTKHEGKLFYILVCRVSLGHHVRSDCGKNVFPITNRELAFVPTTMPPVHYHSLLGVDFPRYREFIVFHTEYIYPEYLIAYQRFNGKTGPI